MKCEETVTSCFLPLAVWARCASSTSSSFSGLGGARLACLLASQRLFDECRCLARLLLLPSWLYTLCTGCLLASSQLLTASSFAWHSVALDTKRLFSFFSYSIVVLLLLFSPLVNDKRTQRGRDKQPTYQDNSTARGFLIDQAAGPVRSSPVQSSPANN